MATNDQPRDGVQQDQDVVPSSDALAPTLSPEELRASLEREREEKEKIAAALKKANKESADRRHRLEELERAEEDRNRAKLSEEERARRDREARERETSEAKAQLARLQDENLQLRIDGLVKDEARKLDFTYPELIAEHIKREQLAIDEDGRISGVKAAVERLAKEYPGLLSAPRGGGSPAAIRSRQGGGHFNSDSSNSPNAPTLEDVLRRSSAYSL